MLTWFTLLLHRHQWRKSVATYTPPWDDGERYVAQEYRTMFATTGMTCVLLLCVACGADKILKMHGKPIDKALAMLVGLPDE